jgi:hypothetical protein
MTVVTVWVIIDGKKVEVLILFVVIDHIIAMLARSGLELLWHQCIGEDGPYIAAVSTALFTVFGVA